jgi:signal transduction histidine kinase
MTKPLEQPPASLRKARAPRFSLRFRDLSVRGKVTIISLVTSICVLLLTTTIFAIFDLMMYHQRILTVTTSIAQVIGNNSKAAIAFDDPEAAERTLAALRDIPQIQYACILDRAGRVFSLYAQNAHVKVQPPKLEQEAGFVVQDGALCVQSPVIIDDEWMGSVYIRHSMAQFHQHLRRIIAVAAVVLLLAILASWSLSMRLQNLVSEPLRNLADTARHISEDRDFSRRATQHSNDEIGFLVGRVNEMLDEIQKQDAELRARAKLLEANQERLRSLASELLLTEERERRNLATDLHDTVCQALAIAKIKLDCMNRPASPDTPSSDLDQVTSLVTDAIAQTRSALFQLSPQVLYEVGLEEAIDDLADRMEGMFPMEIRIEDDGNEKPLSDDRRVLVFRCVQELLMNAAKHAKASQASVSLACIDGCLTAEVSDNGVGFVPDAALAKNRTHGYGLFSIQERVRHFGGSLAIQSEPGKGTRITLRIPAATAPSADACV